MTARFLDWTASLTLRRPVAVLVAVAAMTVLLVANTRNLQLKTDIADLVGSSSASGRALHEYIQEFGYGNRFFVIVQSPGAAEPDAERMESVADRLARQMQASGRFTSARSQVSEAEMLQIARYYLERFPAFADPKRRDALAERLSPAGVRLQLRQGAERLLTSFSTIGPQYFVLDPLGLLEFAASPGTGGFSGFDLEWGSGGRFFSRDHRALLVIAEPSRPSTDYDFAVGLMTWMRGQVAAVRAESAPGEAPLEVVPVGAHAYADQTRALMERNVRVASIVSVVGNLLLVLIVYRWLPAVALSVLPTFLALLWTTGLISTYPGEINLISLAFIAILTGLGDDQVTYFFTRVPQEIAAGCSLPEAIRRTYVTTGKSVLFCVLASGTGTLTLALAEFKGLAELGLVLTIGLLTVLVHTLFTVPAVIRLIWPSFPVRTQGGPFRILPTVARGAGALVARHPAKVVAAAAVVLVVAAVAIPGMRTTDRFESFASYDDPAFVGQRLLASRFGLEGAPLVLLVEGTEQEVLSRTAALQVEIEQLRRGGRGGIRSVLAPTSFVPSREQQAERGRALAGLDWEAAARSLSAAVTEAGLAKEAFEPAVALLRQWGRGAPPAVTVAQARRALPRGFLDDSIRELAPGRYVGAVTLYSGAADATASLPSSTLARLRQRVGPFTAFSYDQVAIDLNEQIGRDSRRASLLATVAVIAIVTVLFRSLRLGLLVLLPIGYGIAVTVGLLALAGHRFGAMGFAAFPLIVGIGIDNSIHLVRRHLEAEQKDVRRLLAMSGAPLIQSNLTTIVGFGALMSATIPPLAELGLITAVGIALTLLASLLLLPAILQLGVSRAGRAAGRGGDPSKDDEKATAVA